MAFDALIDEYVAGPHKLREAVAGMPPGEWDARPISGKWSTREVVCHLADCEPVYADRMKRIIAEEQPAISALNPDAFAARLAYAARDVDEELALIESTRRHVARILRTLSPGDFQRTANHSIDGPVTLETLLRRITEHIPHHIRFIEEKRQALS
ncbi:MAG TPA: DinB family protein [Planctomycetaceae bacterium]|nr:DinB family protein [Planctomycetaceae bacterium]